MDLYLTCTQSSVLGIHISKERNILVAAEHFIRSLVESMESILYTHRWWWWNMVSRSMQLSVSKT